MANVKFSNGSVSGGSVPSKNVSASGSGQSIYTKVSTLELKAKKQGGRIDEAEKLLKKVKEQQNQTFQLVYLGFLILVFTALGVAIGFLNLVIDVYNSKVINAI